MALKLVSIALFFISLFFWGCSKETGQEADDLKDNQIVDMLYGPDGKANWDVFKEDLDYLLSRQSYAEILKKIEKNEKIFPDQKIALAFIKGISNFGIGKTDLAKENLKLAEQDKDLKDQVVYYYGHIARKEGDFNKAESYYKQYYEMTKTSEALSSLADLYHENKKESLAMEYYQKAITANPESYMDRYFLANLYFEKGNLDQSEKLLKESLEINKGFKKSYLGLYAIAQKKGRKVDELYYFSRALLLDQNYEKTVTLLEKDPIVLENAQLVKFYLISLARTGLKEKFKSVLNTALKKFPKDPDIETYLGISYTMDGDNKKAVSYFRELVRRYPQEFNVVVAYGDALTENKQVKESIAVYERALLIDPTNTSYRYKLAEIYRKENNMDKEIFHRGVLSVYQQQLTEALEYLTRVQKPDYPDLLYFYLGKVYSERKNVEEGIRSLEKAISINKKMTQAYLELAYLYIQKQQKKKAIEMLSSYPGYDKEIQRLKNFILKM